MTAESRPWFILAWVFAAGWLIWKLAPVITPFAIAAGLAYLTDPLVDRIEKWRIGSRLFGRTTAVVLVFAFLTALLVVGALVIVPLIIRQVHQLTVNVPAYIDWFTTTALPWLTDWLELAGVSLDLQSIRELLGNYWRELSGAAFNVLESLGRGGRVVMQVVANLVLVPVVAFYLMRDWDRLVNGVRNLLPRSIEGDVSRLAREIDEVLGAFIRGQFIVMLALGMVYALGLWLIGLQAAFLIGMGAGLLSIVPYLGSIVGLLMAVGVALFQFGDWLHLALVLAVFGVGQSLEGMVLTPKLVGDRIGLHPVAVIFAVLAGGQLFGFLGILLALPVAAALNVIARHAHEIYQHSAIYTAGGD